MAERLPGFSRRCQKESYSGDSIERRAKNPGFWINRAHLQKDRAGRGEVGRKASICTSVQMQKSLEGKWN